jgi:hypothetical protein
MKPPLGTPEEEAALCRAAWDANPSEGGWHIHHSRLWEGRTYSIEDRIRYIETQKPERERALRLRLLRPMSEKDHADIAAIWAKCDADDAAIWAKRNADIAAIRAKRNADIAPIRAKCNADIAPIRAKCNADDAAIWAKCDADIAPIHQAACPECPWNDTDIFGGAK